MGTTLILIGDQGPRSFPSFYTYQAFYAQENLANNQKFWKVSVVKLYNLSTANTLKLK